MQDAIFHDSQVCSKTCTVTSAKSLSLSPPVYPFIPLKNALPETDPCSRMFFITNTVRHQWEGSLANTLCSQVSLLHLHAALFWFWCTWPPKHNPSSWSTISLYSLSLMDYRNCCVAACGRGRTWGRGGRHLGIWKPSVRVSMLIHFLFVGYFDNLITGNCQYFCIFQAISQSESSGGKQKGKD